MTNPLEILKTQLEKALDESGGTEDFILAIEDCIYACNLGTTALTQHFDIWLTVCPIDCEYRKGVQFVSEQWDKIIFKDKENDCDQR